MGRKPIYQTIHDDILSAMAEGRYEVGDQLPTEKELSETYRVSRITSKQALNLLAQEGYADRRKGRGTIVLTLPQRDSSARKAALVY